MVQGLDNLSSTLNVERNNQGLMNYGNRVDGTPKGSGWLGELQASNGDIMTELSSTFEVDGQEYLMPLLVPTLSDKEVNYLLEGNTPTSEIEQKAFLHGMGRIRQGKSPFIEENIPSSQGLENYGF